MGATGHATVLGLVQQRIWERPISLTTPPAPTPPAPTVPARADAVVLGAGFYGAVIALELRRLGLRRVLLVEREPAILRRASYVNQARVHHGYHYPRSLATAERSRANFERFVADWADAVPPATESLYAIAQGSRVGPAQFEAFCRTVGIPCHPASRSLAALFEPALVQESYLVRELAFDATRLAARLSAALAASGIELLLDTEGRILGDPPPGHPPGVLLALGEHRVVARHVLNCTYGAAEFAGVALRTRIKKELAEMLLLVPPIELEGRAVTVMDGPFFSAVPFPAAGLHSFSHVRFTPHAASVARVPEPLVPLRSNGDAMLRDGARFLPCLARARVMGSMFEMKATLLRNEDDDGRPILMERSLDLPRVLTVLGAKIDNVYDVLDYLRAQDWTA